MPSPLALLLAVAPSAAGPSTAQILEDVTLTQQVALVNAGAAPRAVVRYQPRAGATATYEMRTRTGMDLSMTGPDGQPISIPLGGMVPTSVLSMKHTVGQPVDNGLIPVRVEQLGARVEGAPPEMSAAMREGLAQTEGMSFQLLVDPAVGRPVQLDVVGGTDPALGPALEGLADQLVQQMATFPAEPVGRGAKWTSETQMGMSGLDLRVTQTSTVTAVSAGAVDLDVAMTMRIAEGPVQMPGLPPGAEVEVVKFTGTGGGAMKVDLGTLVTTGAMAMDLDMTLRMAAPGQPPMEMGMKMDQQTEMALK
jgi:hypothetical protein